MHVLSDTLPHGGLRWYSRRSGSICLIVERRSVSLAAFTWANLCQFVSDSVSPGLDNVVALIDRIVCIYMGAYSGILVGLVRFAFKLKAA